MPSFQIVDKKVYHLYGYSLYFTVLVVCESLVMDQLRNPSENSKLLQ